jgi:hypothetical protein
MCTQHGGGDRCQHIDCDKSAAHSKSGMGTVGMCFQHGGGDCCKHVDDEGNRDCNSSAANSKNGEGVQGMCVKHKGGNRCQHINADGIQDCDFSAQHCKTGNGNNDMCKRHGGGDRCQQICCKTDPTVASGRHPDTGEMMCTQAMRHAVILASENDSVLQERLMQHFGFKRSLVNRGELVFYHRLNILIPELRHSERFLDESIISKSLGKRKSIHDLRPDYFHIFDIGNEKLALHGEYDERPCHENDDDRLNTIAEISGCGVNNTYVFRIMANHDTDKAVCKRFVVNKNHVYFKLSNYGEMIAQQTAKIIKQRIEWITNGLPPNDAENRKRKVLINF